MAQPQQTGVFGKMRSGLSAFGEQVQSHALSLHKNVQGHLATAATAITTKVQELDLVEDLSQYYGPLWESNESVTNCRQCKGLFMAPLKTKHHCRSCAGIFCVDCLSNLDINSSSVAQQAAQVCPSNDGATVKLCGGCVRGECPGREIKEQVTKSLEETIKKASKRSTSTLAAAREKAAASAQTTNASAGYHQLAVKDALQKTEQAKPKTKSGIEKLVSTIGDTLGVLAPGEDVPSVPIDLSRGCMYGGGRGGGVTPPISGYFEYTNKSKELCCVKLVVRGGNPVFEFARPSFIVVPPGESVSASFDISQEQLELLVLFYNPHSFEASAVWDTRSGVAADRISLCAQVARFQSCKAYKINGKERNVLLKYKGSGLVECRRGDSLGRIGLFAKLNGKRWAKGELDYDFNIASINEIKL